QAVGAVHVLVSLRFVEGANAASRQLERDTLRARQRGQRRLHRVSIEREALAAGRGPTVEPPAVPEQRRVAVSRHPLADLAPRRLLLGGTTEAGPVAVEPAFEQLPGRKSLEGHQSASRMRVTSCCTGWVRVFSDAWLAIRRAVECPTSATTRSRFS